MFSNARQVCTESSQSAPADEDEAVREAHHFKVWKAAGLEGIGKRARADSDPMKQNVEGSPGGKYRGLNKRDR